MDDLSKLTDEELKTAIKTGEESNAPEVVKQPEVAEQPKEVVEEVKEVETPEEVEEKSEPEELVVEEKAEDKEPPKISRRQELAINKILNRTPPPQPEYRPPVETPTLDYGSVLDAEPDVISQFEQDRTNVRESSFNAGLNQARAEIQTSEWRTMLNIDAPKTEEKYPWLNPKDTLNFEPAIADAVNTEYQTLIGYNPETGLISNNVRYTDFVEARVELSKRLAEAMTEKTAENIAKQAATTAIRPDGSSTKRLNLNRAPEQMTDEELYASLGQTPPKK